MIAEYGIDDWFEVMDKKGKARQRMMKLVEWKTMYNIKPRQNSKDKEENILGRFINSLKSARKGNGHGNWYICYDEIIAEYGMEEWFKI